MEVNMQNEMETDQQPFEQLKNALDNLFATYDGLQKSLESLSKNVFNIPIDARDQAVKISVMGRKTRYNLVFYLKSLKEMTSAMLDMDFEKSKSKTITARFTMRSRLNPQAGAETDSAQMLNALESVLEMLREREQNKQPSDANVDEVINEATDGASSIIKDFTLRLLKYIKEEMKKAVDDSAIVINSSQLEKEVQNVKKAIAETKKSYSENISALSNIITTIDVLIAEDNTENKLISLKANAKTLGETCETKLSSIEASRA